MSATLNLRQVHEFAKVKGAEGSGHWRLVRTNPALRLACAGGDGNTSVVFIQRGVPFTEGGLPMKKSELPAWFTQEIAKCSPQALVECGFKLPELVAAKDS